MAKQTTQNRKSNYKTLLRLFLIFFKIGLFTFGGGYVMIAMLEREFVENKGWMTKDEFMDMAAIAESTPGPIAINSATYIGYKLCGVYGSAVATVAVCLPSFAIIYVISLFFDKFLEIKLVGYAFRGIQVCVVYLIGSAGIKLFKGMKKNAFSYTVFGVVFVCMILFTLISVSFSSIYYVLVSGVAGIAFFLFLNKKEETK